MLLWNGRKALRYHPASGRGRNRHRRLAGYVIPTLRDPHQETRLEKTAAER